MSFVVTIPAPGQTWSKADQNQSGGTRGTEDPRVFLPVAFAGPTCADFIYADSQFRLCVGEQVIK